MPCNKDLRSSSTPPPSPPHPHPHPPRLQNNQQSLGISGLLSVDRLHLQQTQVVFNLGTKTVHHNGPQAYCSLSGSTTADWKPYCVLIGHINLGKAMCSLPLLHMWHDDWTASELYARTIIMLSRSRSDLIMTDW